MTRLIYSTLFIVIASASAHATAAGTAPDSDPGYSTYRRVVQGDISVQLVPPAARAQSRLVPGAYARYLVNNGFPREMALEQALHAGDSPTAVACDTPAAPEGLMQYELYQRSVLGWPIETIERERRPVPLQVARSKAPAAAR